MIVARRLTVVIVFLVALACYAGPAAPVKDLNPVKLNAKPNHAAITLVENGQGKATIAVMGPRSAQLNAAVGHLQSFIEEATGAKLPIVEGKITAPAIVIGDCELAKKTG